MTTLRTTREQYRASPAAIARIAMLYPRPVAVIAPLTVDRAVADGISAHRLQWVAESNKRTASMRRTSAVDATRLERQAAGLLAVAARLVANDNVAVKMGVAA